MPHPERNGSFGGSEFTVSNGPDGRKAALLPNRDDEKGAISASTHMIIAQVSLDIRRG